MKRLLLALMLTGCAAVSLAADGLPTVAKGDHLVIYPTVALEGISKVTVLEVGPAPWIKVEYTRTFTKPGVSGMQTEPAQLWLNTNQLVALRKVES